MNYYLVTFGIETDRQTDRRKATHKSRPCISTGGLNKKCIPFCLKWHIICDVWVTPTNSTAFSILLQKVDFSWHLQPCCTPDCANAEWAPMPFFGILLWPWPTWHVTLNYVTFDLLMTLSQAVPKIWIFSSCFSPVMYRQKATNKGPLCMSTGGLKNRSPQCNFYRSAKSKWPSKWMSECLKMVVRMQSILSF